MRAPTIDRRVKQCIDYDDECMMVVLFVSFIFNYTLLR